MAVTRAVLQLEVPAGDVELASDLLWQASPSAVLEVDLGDGWVRLTADVDDASAPLRAGPGWRVARLEVDPEQDLDAWRTWAAPVRAGSRTVLHPAWVPVPEPGAGDLVVLLDPGRAFGSGSHESTRLAVAALEEVLVPGASVLDVGCGSGVLSVVACGLGAATAVAVDIDPAAIPATEANAAANGCADRVAASTTALDDVPGAFDVVVANIGGPALFDLADGLVRHVAPGGALVASGQLDERADAFASACADLVVEARRSEAGWTALVLRRGAAS